MPGGEKTTPLLHSECLCPICREILLEPVTLPCNHTLCSPCFQMTVEKASLCCPFCRRRVSTWARHHARTKTLVNMELWERIQNQYPEECQRRASGQETEELEDGFVSYSAPLICKPGEIRQEYEAEISKIEKERLAQEEAERKASEEYIQKLLAEEEEEQKQREAKRMELERQLKQDEELARILNTDLNVSNSSSGLVTPTCSPAAAKQAVSSKTCRGQKSKPCQSGDIVRFLSPNPQRQLADLGFDERKNPSPLEISMDTGVYPLEDDDMPTLTPQPPFFTHSQEVDSDTPLAASTLTECLTTHSSKQECRKGTSKRKCEVYSFDSDGVSEKCNSGKKRQRQISEENYAEFSLHTGHLMELEENLYERKQQEEQDRLLALQLQRELDRELKQIIRKKGSPDEYHLRPITRCGGSNSQEHEESTANNPAKLKTDPTEYNLEGPQSCTSLDENKKPVQKQKLRSPRVLLGQALASVEGSPPSRVKVLRPSNKQHTILDLFQRSIRK